MTSLAIVPGTVVWLAIVAGIAVWLALLSFGSRALVGPRRMVRWLLSSWLSRSLMVIAWGAVGWHIFCQRP
jgi:hypothetical protein